MGATISIKCNKCKNTFMPSNKTIILEDGWHLTVTIRCPICGNEDSVIVATYLERKSK